MRRKLLTTLLLAGLPVLSMTALTPDPDNGGLTLPDGFAALVVHEGVGPLARHLHVRDNGDIYIRFRRTIDGSGIAALRDEDGDGRADRIERFTETRGTTVDEFEGYLYFSAFEGVSRVPVPENGELLPTGEIETVVEGFTPPRSHADKVFAISPAGDLYVNVGAPSNACQEHQRSRGSPGLDPCPQLERHAGVWKFDARQTDQTQEGDGVRYATGFRNLIALAWNESADALFGIQHGRDQLSMLFPDLYTDEENAQLPAEEFHRIDEGSNAGWPYTYWDQIRGERMIAPEYGGDGLTPSDNPAYQEPFQSFPGHYAPNDLVFYEGDPFPERYRHGAFVAFHGSWNRAPLEQRGFKVTFSPLDENGVPTGDWEDFAVGFPMREVVRSVRDARHRPCGLAVGPDGSLYVSDSVSGKLWRIFYVGD